jgi:hypothetical protein
MSLNRSLFVRCCPGSFEPQLPRSQHQQKSTEQWPTSARRNRYIIIDFIILIIFIDLVKGNNGIVTVSRGEEHI